MSGHSKWHNIRLRKGKQDAERGKIFTKLGREIIVAAREGGGSPDTNSRLRLAMEKARASSMPQDTIKRAIQRGTGEIEGVHYEEVSHEGYAPGGVAVTVNCLTDNRNRTVADVRNIFSKCGGNLGESGSVIWQFDHKGLINIPADRTDEEAVFAVAVEAGAEDIQTEGDTIEVITPPDALGQVKQALADAGIPIEDFELTMIPKNTIRIEGKEANQVLRLVEMLEDHDDVQQVYANFDVPDEVMEAAGT